MSQQTSERSHAPISFTRTSSSSTAESRTRGSVRRRDRSRRRLRALLCAGGAFTAAASFALTGLVEPPALTEAELVTASEQQDVTAPADAAAEFSREPIAPSSSSAGSIPTEEGRRVSTLSDGKSAVAETVPPEQPEKAGKAPVEEPAEDPSLGAPLSEVSVASPYGNRVNPMGGYGQEMHTGTDFAGACGTPVLASDAGTVTESGWHPYGGGQRIVIDHGEGLKTTYNHLSSLGTAVGEKVERGKPVGAVGTTGNSTGCHLHFEVVVDGKTVDPSGHL